MRYEDLGGAGQSGSFLACELGTVYDPCLSESGRVRVSLGAGGGAANGSWELKDLSPTECLFV